MTSVVRTGYDVRPFAHRGETLSRDFQSAEREMSFLVGAGSAHNTNGKLSLLGKGLQQAHDVACERYANSGRGRGSRKLHGPIVIDAVRNGVILPVTGEGRSRDDQFSATGAAAY